MVFIRNGDFIINGLRGIKDLHTTIEETPDISYPKRKYSTLAIPGSSKDAILDENAYENRKIELKLSVMAENSQERSFRIAKLVNEFSKGDYSDLILYSDPNFKYEVISSAEINVEKPAQNSEYTKITMTLNAGAFKYMYPEEEIKIPLADENTPNFYNIMINNPTNFSARPLIKCGKQVHPKEGLDYYYIWIDDVTQYYNIDIRTGGIIDCSENAQQVYDFDGNKIRNAFDFTEEFPVINPGTCSVGSWNENVTIFPRWRTL